ncbi:ribonuclease HI [Candidatus Saccharibacteria bacterium]|nr:ribonuclease HI [Candidatus Saccharibacteria bacterium]
MLKLWTDGSANPNPGPGGFAVILEQEDGTGKPVILGREKNSSNIRMEGWAIIAAIKGAKGRECEIHTDSKFWVNVITKWMEGWAANGWKKKRGEIANLDIVKKLYDIYEPKLMKFVWVRGHVGTELNEMADEWANKARLGEKL